MMLTSPAERRDLENLPRESLCQRQLARLHALLVEIMPHNALYRRKLGAALPRLTSLADLQQLPFTTKADLLSADDPYAANRTWPLDRYTRLHRTSGTQGRPLAVVDAEDDWQWWMEAWQYVYDALPLTPADRVLAAFSFGPFVGFWSAFEAAVARGALAIPTGGMSTLARLDAIGVLRPSVLLCTPSYALHMAETAAANGLEAAALGVQKILVAGEPGGSIPAVRSRLQHAWRAVIVDHAGATEVGPWGYGRPEGGGLFVNEACFLAEFVDPESGAAVADGDLGELVLTTLGRAGAPVIRYRTGDLVRVRRPERGFAFLEGGVVGRRDDMLIIRGVNVFPSSLEAVLREFPEVAEYRVTVRRVGEMDALHVEVEDVCAAPERIVQALQRRLGIRVEVSCAPLGSLPRFEGKGRRWHDAREGRA